VTGHWFVRWEYGKAGFPPDPFGLSSEERIRMAETCVDYLVTGADISLLGDQRLYGGQPAFNDRELRHMDDVQTVFEGMTVAGIVAAMVVVAGSAALLAWDSTRRGVPNALLGGSLLTLGLLAAVGAYIVLSWGQFFTTFHRIFFEGETWIFPYSDTLIRLFPQRFWMDVAATLVGILVVEAIVVGVVGWRWSKSLSNHASGTVKE
jgi:integral membrane protein (TIGR01906 family)